MSESDAQKSGQPSSADGALNKPLAAMGLLVAMSATVLLCIVSAPYVANIIVIALLVLMAPLLVYAFGMKVLPTSGAALILTLPVLGGVAVLCHTLWNVRGSHSTREGVILLQPEDWLFVLLCLFPYFLAFSMALLILVRHDYRRCVVLEHREVPGTRKQDQVEPQKDTGKGSMADEDKRQMKEREIRWHQIEDEWNFERNRFSAIEAAAAQQSFIYGAVTSLTLIVCAVLIATVKEAAKSAADTEIRLVAISIASATASSFLLNGGRIMLRVASQEASSRMFAWASKLQLASALAGALLGMLVANKIIKVGVSDVSAAVIGGLLIGFLGGRAIQAIIERAAASLSGVKIPTTALQEIDLKKLDGIDVDDIERFVEEGITSIHDLANTPTPRLYFNTQYSLPMICDWQSQAILFDKLQDSTQTFRIAHGVRGAVDAVRILKGEPLSPERRSGRGRPTRKGRRDTPPPPVDRSASEDPVTARAEAKIGDEVRLARRLLLKDETIEKLDLYRCARLCISTEETACWGLKKLLTAQSPLCDEGSRAGGDQRNQQQQQQQQQHVSWMRRMVASGKSLTRGERRTARSA